MSGHEETLRIARANGIVTDIEADIIARPKLKKAWTSLGPDDRDEVRAEWRQIVIRELRVKG